MASSGGGNNRIRFYLILLIILAAGLGVFYYLNRRAALGPGAGLNLPFVTQPEALPEVPKIYSKQSIFEKIQSLDFRSYVNLPVQVGNIGKPNPFEPFSGFMEGGQTSGSNTSSPATGSGGSSAPENMSQGSK